MNFPDFDEEELNQKSADQANAKMWMNGLAGSADQYLNAGNDRESNLQEILIGRKLSAPPKANNAGLAKSLGDSMQDPWEKQKKTYEMYKAAKEGKKLEREDADETSMRDPNDKKARALKAMIASKHGIDPASLDGYGQKDLMDLYGDPKRLAEIQAQAQINHDNAMATQASAQKFQARENQLNRNNELAKISSKERMEMAKKSDPNERLKNMSSTDKARFDNAMMVMKSVDQMGAALDEGDNTFSLIGDNKYTAAERQAAEAYGRMQSGGAINKEEEERFLNMLPRKTDSAEMQRSKLLGQRNEMVSRLKTLGFTPEDAGYVPQEFAYGSGKPKSVKSAVAKEKPKSIVQNGHTYVLNPKTGEYE